MESPLSPGGFKEKFHCFCHHRFIRPLWEFFLSQLLCLKKNKIRKLLFQYLHYEPSSRNVKRPSCGWSLKVSMQIGWFDTNLKQKVEKLGEEKAQSKPGNCNLVLLYKPRPGLGFLTSLLVHQTDKGFDGHLDIKFLLFKCSFNNINQQVNFHL